MAVTFRLRRSDTAGRVPSASNFADGEILLNTADGIPFIKREDGAVLRLQTSAGSPFSSRIVNGRFQINQRGAASYTGSGYGFDRWYHSVLNGTLQQGAAGSRFSGQPHLAWTRGSTAGARYIEQRVEDVTVLAGRTVTVSLTGMSSPNALSLQVDVVSNHGAGGSAQIITPAGTMGLSGTVNRRSVTVEVPAAVPATIGPGSYTAIRLTFTTGTAATMVYLTDVQLDIGPVALPYAPLPEALELVICQRYYEEVRSVYLGYIASPSQVFGVSEAFSTTKRASPSVTARPGEIVSGCTLRATEVSPSGYLMSATSNGANFVQLDRVLGFDAEL